MEKRFLTTFAVLALTTVLIPTESRAALSFDLWENMNNPGGRFYGYSTRSVGDAPTEDGNFDATGEIASRTSVGTTQSVTSDSSGDVTYTASLPPLNGSLAYIGVAYADIQLTNNTDPLGAATYGIDAINEFHIYYDLSATYSGNGGGGVNAFWFFPGADTTADSNEGYALGSVNTGVGQVLSFQSEDLYAQSGRAPLLLNGETGTLRFEFFSVNSGANTSTATVNLSNISITAVVPEPSSALLLTGVLGLFGGTFRRRRKITVS